MCAFLGRGKCVFARLDAEDNKWHYFSLAYISRTLNGCPRNPKGIRVGVILEDIYAELSKLHFTESHYIDFVKNMRTYTDAKMDNILARKRSVQAEKNNEQH